MKKIFFALSLLFTFNGWSLTIVSDLDDTIKITNAGSAAHAAWNGLFTRNVFTGMPEFFEEARSYVDELHVLSASPAIVGRNIWGLLNKHDIKADSIILKSICEKTAAYKVRVLKDIISESPGETFIIMGDDVNHDPEVFAEVKRAFPQQVIAAYVHVVKDRAMPESVVPYWTSADLALREYEAGRMSFTGVARVMEAVENETKLKKVFPKFADCPKDISPWTWQLGTEFAEPAQRIMERLTQYCGCSKALLAEIP